MEEAERAEVLARICPMCEPFALGWRAERVGARILDIARWAALERSVSLEKRRSIAHKARDLLDELRELGGGGLSEETLADLAVLAQGAAERTGRGGDRRSDEHSAEASVHRMIVRLYVEAREKSGFSKNGPLPRFVANVCDFLGMDAPTDEAVRKIYKKVRPAVKKIARDHIVSALYGAGR